VLGEATLVVKPYPCCAGTHPAIEAALALRARADGARIESVRAQVDAVLPTVLVHDQPATGNEAKFSLRYTVARALVDGHVGIRHFADDALAGAEVGRVMDRLQVEVSNPGLGNYGVVLTARLVDGRELTASVADARVDAPPGVSDERLLAKVADCVGGDERRARSMWEAIREGGDELPAGELVAVTAPGVGAAAPT
jgi:2-methylcitrate dehydratase PrpD